MELFQSASSSTEPLAARMRPRTLEEFVGQEHILAPGRLLRRAIQADQLSSLIFYGPPGTGKTTLAMVIANSTSSAFQTINAVLSGVKQIREAIDQAKERQELYGTRTILFVDEVHRWNKAQQDALLPWVENGTFILIGATTENPYFEVNSALVSRSRIFQLRPLTGDHLLEIARRTLTDTERGYGNYSVDIEPGALEHIADIASGDARSLLNALELAVETTPVQFPPSPGETITVTLETAEESIQKKVVLYDKEGDYHFDTISAFIKSIRGSDPDAALYWLAKMVRAGEDPKYLFRRMLISACEDIGLADPMAVVVTEAAASAFERIGLPEGQFHLTQAALYLATAPKSNSALGYFDALASIEEEEQQGVPLHLKDGSRDKKGFGHGEGYKYPHAYTDHWVAQQYLPKSLQGRVFYNPSDMGYEAQIRAHVERRREAQLEAVFSESGYHPPEEVLTFSPPDKQRDRWIARTLQSSGNTATRIRDEIFKDITVQRHWRVLDLNPGSGLLLLEALRHVPEGGVWGILQSEEKKHQLEELTEHLPEIERPVLLVSENGPAGKGIEDIADKGLSFEMVTGRNVFTRTNNRERIFAELKKVVSPGGIISFVELIPAYGQRLSALLSGNPSGGKTVHLERLKKVEEIVYNSPSHELVNWNEENILRACSREGYTITRKDLVTLSEERHLTRYNLEKWLDFDNPESYGSALLQTAGKENAEDLKDKIITALENKDVPWNRSYLLLRAQNPV